MKRLSFAIGSPPPRSTRQKKEKKNWKAPRSEVSPFVPWRILPSERCDGLFFWMDTLPGSSYFQKRAALAKQIQTIESTSWSFQKESRTQATEEILEKANKLFALLYKNQKIRWILKRFLTRVRILRFPILNDVDPITLERVETPIQIHSFSQRKTYVFEAESFATLVHKKLLAHEGQIPLPQFPKNPLTNEAFLLGQQISLLQQCREQGYSSWSLEAYVTSRYSLQTLISYFKTPLRLSALRTTLATLKTWEAIDTLMDFIESQHDAHNAHFYSTVYKWAIHHAPTSTRIEKWRTLCLKWYENDLLIEDEDAKQAAFALLQQKSLALCTSPTDLQALRFESRSPLDGRRRISNVPGSR